MKVSWLSCFNKWNSLTVYVGLFSYLGEEGGGGVWSGLEWRHLPCCLLCVNHLLSYLWAELTVFLSLFLPAASHLLKKYHGGYVVIRMALAGHKQANRPFYRIVAAHNKRARDGKYIEQLGTYDPLPNIYNEKLVSFNYERIKHWIGCGAHPTKPVAKLLGVYSDDSLNIVQVICSSRELHWD